MAEKMDDARLVFEKASGFHDGAGPWEAGKIGFAIGERVFWTDSYTFPGDNTVSHAEKVAFAHEIVLRLNRGAHALAALPDDPTSEALDLIIELRAENAALRERLGEPEPEKPKLSALLARLGHGGRAE